jgi:hypothetical protein
MMLTLLQQEVREHPTLLIVEDIHWLDSTSWRLTLSAIYEVHPLIGIFHSPILFFSLLFVCVLFWYSLAELIYSFDGNATNPFATPTHLQATFQSQTNSCSPSPIWQ